MNTDDSKYLYALRSAENKEPIAWVLILLLLAMILGNNLFNKITLLIGILYFSFRNKQNIKEIFTAFKSMIWFILLMTWAVASVLWSVVPKVTIDIAITQFAFFMFAVLAARYAIDININKSLKILAYITLGLIFTYIVLFPGASQSTLGLKAFYAHKNNLGIVLSVCILIISSSIKLKWFEYILTGVAFGALILSQSKTSLTILGIVASIGLSVFIFSNFYKNRTKFSQGFFQLLGNGIAWILYVLIGLIVISREQISEFLINVLPYKFLTGRGELWLTVLKRTSDDLLTGLGLGTFWNAGKLSEIAQTSLILKAPLWVEKLGSADGGYIDLIGSLGFIGLSLFLFSTVSIYQKLIKQKNLPEAKLIFASITFFVFHNTTETTLFHSTNILWFLYIFTSFYLIFKINNLNIYPKPNK